MCQVRFKLAQWFLRRRFLNFVDSMYFRYFVIFPLGKGSWIPFTQGCFVFSLVEIGPVDLEKTMKMWKVYDNGDHNNDDRQRTNFDQKSWLEPLAQVSWKKMYMKNKTCHVSGSYSKIYWIVMVSKHPKSMIWGLWENLNNMSHLQDKTLTLTWCFTPKNLTCRNVYMV